MWDWLRHALKAKGQHLEELRIAHKAGYALGYNRGKAATDKQLTWSNETALREAETILEAKNNGL